MHNKILEKFRNKLLVSKNFKDSKSHSACAKKGEKNKFLPQSSLLVPYAFLYVSFGVARPYCTALDY